MSWRHTGGLGMFLELFFWNVSARFKRLPLLLGCVAIMGYLFLTSLSQYSVLSGTPMTTTALVLGRVRSLTFVLILVELMGLHTMYGNGSIHMLLRSGSRGRYWQSRLLATFSMSGLFAMLLILVEFMVNVLIGRLFPRTGAAPAHSMQSGALIIVFLLLTVGIAVILVLIDVLQVILSHAFLAYVLVIALQIVSLTSNALFSGATGRLLFLLSPFLRLSLIDNSLYGEQPIRSVSYLALLLALEFLVGWLAVRRNDIQ